MCRAAVACAVVAAVPAIADVRTGVDAWSRGDYAAAVAEWEGPASSGDPDAMFNLGQAYRLGRGVVQDTDRAEQLYFRAAQYGHVQAADTYGLMLFQDGRREEALPFVQDAARRGDPRSQYLLGIAHFNGDLVERDWVRAYALLTLANSSGLPQATPAIAEMDNLVSLVDRQQAAGLAQEMRAQADATRAAELAAADLGVQQPAAVQSSPRVPRPIATTAVSPSVAAARAAIVEASQATGTDSPSSSGAAYTAPSSAAPRIAGSAVPSVAAASPPEAAPVSAPTQVQDAPQSPAPVQQVRASGPWRVQLGAFGVRANAERLWNRLSSRSEIAGYEQLMIPSGRVVKLQAGGYATQADAQSACRSLQASGQDCLVTRN